MRSFTSFRMTSGGRYRAIHIVHPHTENTQKRVGVLNMTTAMARCCAGLAGSAFSKSGCKSRRLECHFEIEPAGNAAAARDRTAACLDAGLHDGEPEADTAGGAVPRDVRPVKGIE